MKPTAPIDLRRLPMWIQYVISLTVIGVIVGAAWIVGRHQPVPVWITKYLIPALGWLYLVLAGYLLWRRLARKPPL